MLLLELEIQIILHDRYVAVVQSKEIELQNLIDTRLSNNNVNNREFLLYPL